MRRIGQEHDKAVYAERNATSGGDAGSEGVEEFIIDGVFGRAQRCAFGGFVFETQALLVGVV